MENNKEFSQVVKQRADGLRVEPSANAWAKLDDRLNQHDRKTKVISLRTWLAYAASAAVLVFAVVNFSYYLDSPNTAEAQSVAYDGPKDLMDLDEMEDSEVQYNFAKVVEYKQQMKSRASKTIDEGWKGMRLYHKK